MTNDFGIICRGLSFAVVCLLVLPALPTTTYYTSVWVDMALDALTGTSIDTGTKWKLDRTLTVEGMATAAAACGEVPRRLA